VSETSLRQLAIMLGLTVAACSLLPAQRVESPNPTCFRARPLPWCRVVLLTNAGGYFNLAGPMNGESRVRAIVDWGVIVNTSPRDGFGASWFVKLDQDDLSAGPVLRYRRWFSSHRSLDLAVGAPITGNELRPGSILAMIKYNPEHWAGVALRPEYVRRATFTCNPTCAPRTVAAGHMYAGVEVGWYPGLTLSIGGGVLVGLLLIALAGAD